ncbi:Gfo/Idh/MocA family protein [Bacillus sp. AFS041924]|uniref:Gfo/Idh/MocA family protein n=1 Tax=Bacillus sp. AFS041924 TaxID=2033503 RepID=UPI000BFB4E04|nr:Gfo/Idh/MocA family oxidoreductase [Bacillus sp. AFS041924]PGS48265.1 virulence factor MviM [Bacillus sp. AFS041924]
MKKPRIGMVGLGNIAQKAYLPILTKEENWNFIGAFSPSKEKRKKICSNYRIQDFDRLDILADQCDALFVHSSTNSHFEVVSYLLNNGKDVYVDKPLAATLQEAEKLAELSIKLNRKLMVGFNRRFCPMYVKAKEQAKNIAIIRFEKHRENSIGPNSFEFTMLDDYLHLVDTVRWFANGDMKLINGKVQLNLNNQLEYATHQYESKDGLMVNTDMHRKAGTNLERLELITEGSIIRVKNMNNYEIEQNNSINNSFSSSWDTTLKQRGFEDCINHFINCINSDENPSINGEEALKSQIIVEEIIRQANER